MKRVTQDLGEIRELLRSIKMDEISEAVAERLARCWELVAEIEEQIASEPPPPPTLVTEPIALVQEETAIPIKAKSTPTIAIVDDDPDVQRMLSFVLKRKGFGVHGFADPREALEKLAAIQPDVILLDLMMPQMTGFEFLEQFKTLRKQLPGVRIIVGSARSFDSDRLAVLKAGANDFVAKPYNLDELVLRINNLMAA